MIPKPDKHEHKWEIKEEITVAVRGVVKEKGKTTRDTMTARDTVKLFKCKCGATRAYDLERKKL